MLHAVAERDGDEFKFLGPCGQEWNEPWRRVAQEYGALLTPDFLGTALQDEVIGQTLLSSRLDPLAEWLATPPERRSLNLMPTVAIPSTEMEHFIISALSLDAKAAGGGLVELRSDQGILVTVMAGQAFDVLPVARHRASEVIEVVLITGDGAERSERRCGAFDADLLDEQLGGLLTVSADCGFDARRLELGELEERSGMTRSQLEAARDGYRGLHGE